MTRSRVRRGVLVALLAFASACGMYIRPHPGVIYVGIAPPPPHGEVIVTGPGRGYAWMPGHWAWRVREYVWIPGGWIEVAPGFGDWVPGQWSHDYHGWFWIEGRWR